ncbi:MAG: hypothetical protein JXA99_09420 [Candidatus Lokiarchaeota archaeon]|nr:hypothetical protein [Candidatus Lokiarchaeota archaeon]
MLIDPRVKSIIIFNEGGGIVKREIKLTLQTGSNNFEIQNIPASFDPNSAEVKLKYLKPEDKTHITLQQTITSLPDIKNANQLIEREKSAAQNIISHSIDFTREMRDNISNICEASSYKTYADMNGIFEFIVNSSRESEILVEITYFINDIRIKWNTTLHVNINKSGKTAEIEGFLVIDNQTGFSYNHVDLGFAIYKIPEDASLNLMQEQEQQAYFQSSAIGQDLQQSRKKTQRLKNLML